MSPSMIVRLLVYAAVLIPVEIAGLYLFHRFALREGRPWRGAILLCLGVTAVALPASVIGLNAPAAASLFSSFLFIHLPLVMLIAAGMCAAARRIFPAVTGAVVAVALALVGWDAFRFEPWSLQVSHVEIPTEKVDRRLRIVILADFQTDEIGFYEQWVIEAMAGQKPDLVLLLGDYIQYPRRPQEKVEQKFQRIWRRDGPKPPLGTYAIRGNVDPECWEKLFTGLDVQTCPQNKVFDVGPVTLTCLGMPDSFDQQLRLADPDELERFQIVAGHSPNYMLGETPGDLLLAGHTHGGQVQVPFFGPLLTLAAVPRRWSAGELSRRDDGATVRVSRGTGMERGDAPRLRFWCRPEIVVIDLVPK